MSLKVRFESRSMGVSRVRNWGRARPEVPARQGVGVLGRGRGRRGRDACGRGVWCAITSDRLAEDKPCRALGAKERSLGYLCNGKSHWRVLSRGTTR